MFNVIQVCNTNESNILKSNITSFLRLQNLLFVIYCFVFVLFGTSWIGYFLGGSFILNKEQLYQGQTISIWD